MLMVQLFAQSVEQQADSLQLLIKDATEDTLKAQYYYELGVLYIYNAPDKAVSYLHKARFLSKKTAFNGILGETYTKKIIIN